MQLSLLLGKKILSMFLIVLVGLYLTKSGRFSQKDADALARLNITIICPCAIFYSYQMEFSKEKLSGLLVAVLAGILIHILFIGMDLILRPIFHLSPCESASTIYTNGLNLILPIVSATLGPEMVFYCSAFVMIQTILIWTHCLMLISGEKKFRLRSILNPNIISILLGFLFFVLRIQLPGILDTTVSGIGSMVGPVSMLVIGMLMGPIDLKRAFMQPRNYLICFLRLIVFPAAAALFLRFSGIMKLHPDSAQLFLVTMIAAASCTAASVPQIAQVYGDEADYASMLNVLTLAFCIITMPLIILFYQFLL